MKNRNVKSTVMIVTVGAMLSLGVVAATTKPVKKQETHAGPAKQFGDGSAHAYVKRENGKVVEIGFQFSEEALLSLKPGAKWQPGHHHESHEYSLELPKEAGITPIRFLELDWMPGGHEPPGVYDTPHFDFHFYFIRKQERDAIVPTDPEYHVKAARQPAPEFIPAGYILPPGTLLPRMGVHWVNADSPELHGASFTHTFIRGAWNGSVTFVEPMISRAYLLTKPNAVFPIAQPRCVEPAGAYPTQYGIRYDESKREYQVYLTSFEQRGCATRSASAD